MPKNDEDRRRARREYDKQWYQRHRERLRVKSKQHNADLRLWLRQYKSRLSCMVCGESHPACLQFHHRDPAKKTFNIGNILGQWKYISWQRLEEEIQKCEILCGNCHAKLHWEIQKKQEGEGNAL